MTAAIDTVSAFLAEWARSPEALQQSIRDYFTAETVWENVGLATTTGIDEALALLDSFAADFGVSSIRVDLLNIAAAGEVVLTERVDRMLAADGRELMAIRLMGIFELDGGKIIRFRDYFDTAAIPKS